MRRKIAIVLIFVLMGTMIFAVFKLPREARAPPLPDLQLGGNVFICNNANPLNGTLFESMTEFRIWVNNTTVTPPFYKWTRYPQTGWYITDKGYYSAVLPYVDKNVNWSNGAEYRVEFNAVSLGYTSTNATSNGTGSVVTTGGALPEEGDPEYSNFGNISNRLSYWEWGTPVETDDFQQWDLIINCVDLIPWEINVFNGTNNGPYVAPYPSYLGPFYTLPGQPVILNSSVRNPRDSFVNRTTTIAFWEETPPGSGNLGPFFVTDEVVPVPALTTVPAAPPQFTATWPGSFIPGTFDLYVTVDYPWNASQPFAESMAFGNVTELDDTDSGAPNLEYLKPENTNNTVRIRIIVPSPELLPPYINGVQIIGADLNLTWVLSPSITVNAYDIYGGPTQVSIDFSAPIFSTPDDTAPTQRWWAQFPFDTVGNPEYYFVARSRANTIPVTNSTTSNTAGYYTMSFSTGLNTFSLPLKPFVAPNLDTLMTQVGAYNVSWLDNNNDWQTYPSTPAPQSAVGNGYVLMFNAPTSYIFTGEPGAMIMYDEAWGFTPGSLVDAVVLGNDIQLTWPDLGAPIIYYVYWSSIRDGFFPGSPGTFMILNGGAPVVGNTYTHPGAAAAAGGDYYMIIPRDPIGATNGSSTYSIGVFTAEYNGNEMFGLPLMRMGLGEMSADWYADQIPYCLGIVYYKNGLWLPHFKEFDLGVYDTTVTYGKGYVLSVYMTSLYSHIGW